MKQETILNAKPTDIARSPFNRQVDMKSPLALELIESIRTHGIIQPLIVRPGANGKPYELIAGERRWRAGMILQLPAVPIIVKDATDTEALEQQLAENKDREDLSPIEEAEKYQQILDSYANEKPPVTGDAAIARLVKQTGRSKSAIYESLRLTKLAPKIKEAASAIPQSHLGLLAKLEGDQNAQERVLKEIQKPQAWESESTAAGGRVLSFRVTKDLVDSEIRTAKARKDWEKLAAEYKAKGGKVLGEKDSHANLVRADEFNYDYSQYGKAYKDLTGKHAPAAQLGHDSHTWKPIYFYDRKEALAAIEKAGHKKRKQQSSSAPRNKPGGSAAAKGSEVRNKEISRIREQRLAVARDEIIKKAENISGENSALWTWMLRQLDSISGFANAKEIAARVGVKTQGYYVPPTLLKKLEGKTAKYLRGTLVLALMPDLNDAAYAGASKWDTELVDTCKTFGVKVPEFKIDLPKVQTPGKSKPAKKTAKA